MPRSLSTAIIRLAEANSSAESLADIYAAALEGITAVTGVERASILLFDPDGVMRFKAWTGLSEAIARPSKATRRGPRAPAARTDCGAGRARAMPPSCTIATFAASASRTRLHSHREPRPGHRQVHAVSRGAEPVRPGELPGLAIGYQIGFAVERTRREQEIVAGHQRMLFALDAAQMGTWQWDVAANAVPGRTTWNGSTDCRRARSPARSRAIEREIHPDDRDACGVAAARADGLAAHDVEYRIVAPDGTVRWVQGKGRVELDASGHRAR